jgi:hypothetical protein
MGHYGKLAAEPSGEFMQRANIRPQDFVTEAPGVHVAPWLPRLRAELGPDATDEDLLLSAFYEKSLLAPLKRPAPAYQFHTSPLCELIRHIGTRAGVAHARVRFAGADISLSA